MNYASEETLVPSLLSRFDVSYARMDCDLTRCCGNGKIMTIIF